ncbi:MAG TPA: Uma2 family endonuclease [Polyangiaceae bacterium]
MSLSAPYVPRPPSSDELPFDDGEPMESDRHVQQMLALIQSLDDAWKERDDFYVGGNMFLYFSETQSGRNDFRGPDVFVVLNTTRRERKSWVVWEEGGKAPDVIIELLSESTEKADRGEKMQIYARSLRVGEYFLFDPFSGVLEGYELDPLHGSYRPKAADEQGRVRCEQLGLLLGKVHGTIHSIEADWLRWMTPAGEVLEIPAERAATEKLRADEAARRADEAARRADEAARRADEAAQRAEEANERANRLAAELEALRRSRS